MALKDNPFPAGPKLRKPPLLSTGNTQNKRQELREYFCQTWALYESLFSLINNEQAYFKRPEPLRHPLIFYFGHTAVFFINKLLLGQYISERVNPHIESICAVGVDEMSWDDLKPDNYQWPSVGEVRAYRDQVKQRVLAVIDTMPLTLPIQPDSLAWIILMGCEHERIHIETSSVIMRMLPVEDLTPQAEWAACQQFSSTNTPDNFLQPVSGKQLTLGKPASNDTYGWDNEYGQLSVDVTSFSASKMLVSNGEYLTFVEAGGYQQVRWWTEEGQNWLAFTQAKMPRFWQQQEGTYWQRNLTELIPLPLNWPVEVNYLEAKAFCNWLAATKGKHIRLPTEAEWQCLRDQLVTDLPSWSQAPGNINLEHYASSCPVDAFAQGEFYDVIGNVWQWTESPIDGYPGFAVHPLYDDFSTPTFDGQHNLIKGGSWIATGNEATRDSRYAFRRHFFQHAGFRYVESDSAEVPVTPVNTYENQAEIARLLHHHYAEHAAQPEHDLQQIMRLLQPYLPEVQQALDIGCGVGRLSFELAKQVKHVQGIDFTARHIQHALQLKEQGRVRYTQQTEGELLDYHEISLQSLGLDNVASRVDFCQGDGHNLKPQFNHYQLIVCHRVLEYSYQPRQLLECLIDRLQPGGLLVLGSAFQWSAAHTQAEHWLGGVKQDGEDQFATRLLHDLLSEQFTLLGEHSILTRFWHNRRYSECFDNQLMLWRKAMP